MKRLILNVLSVLALIAVSNGVVHAESSSSSAVSVSPAIEQLQLSAGQNTADFPASIQNRTDTAIQVKIGFVDFKALNDSGGVAFLNQTGDALANKHGLVHWVQLGSEQVGLSPGQKATVSVHLTNLQALPPGGHYGAITYTVVPQSSGLLGNHVQFNQVLSSLVFVVTANGGTQHLTMLPPSGLGWLRFSMPKNLDLFFKNDGNTQTAPRGVVAIYGASKADNPVATAVINHGSAIALPDSVRQLPTPLTVTRHSWLPHHYHVQIRYRPDGVPRFSTYTTGFWYVPPIFIPIVAVVIWGLSRLRRIWRRRQDKKNESATVAAAKTPPKSKTLRGQKVRTVAHTVRVESILVWRDCKLLLRWIRKKMTRR